MCVFASVTAAATVANASIELDLHFPLLDDVTGRCFLQIKLICGVKDCHVLDLSQLDKGTPLLVGRLDVVATDFGETVVL